MPQKCVKLSQYPWLKSPREHPDQLIVRKHLAKNNMVQYCGTSQPRMMTNTNINSYVTVIRYIYGCQFAEAIRVTAWCESEFRAWAEGAAPILAALEEERSRNTSGMWLDIGRLTCRPSCTDTSIYHIQASQQWRALSCTAWSVQRVQIGKRQLSVPAHLQIQSSTPRPVPSGRPLRI